jgi:hypothetical protein
MTNDILINLLAWCKRERERLQMQREMLQSGRFRIFETEESGQKDISNQHVEQIAANIAELDSIIAGSSPRWPKIRSFRRTSKFKVR